MIKYYKVRMINNDIGNCKLDMPLPKGYYFVNYRDNNDQLVWADIEMAAGEFSTVDKALEKFKREFGDHKEELQSRCYFLYSPDGEPVGTATGWFDNLFNRQEYGRLHYVAIKPEYQGKHLAKPLVAMALKRIQQSHDKAYLTSQTTSWKAINMYLDFGFRPLYFSEDCKEAWKLLEEKLKHPALV